MATIDQARTMLNLLRAGPGGEFICSDDCIAPEGVTITYHGVTRVDPPLVCTLRDGHDGPHIALGYHYDGSDEVIHTWARGTGRAG